jgi:hypothetical protein
MTGQAPAAVEENQGVLRFGRAFRELEDRIRQAAADAGFVTVDARAMDELLGSHRFVMTPVHQPPGLHGNSFHVPAVVFPFKRWFRDGAEIKIVSGHAKVPQQPCMGVG